MAVCNGLLGVSKCITIIKGKAIWEASWLELWGVSSFGVSKVKALFESAKEAKYFIHGITLCVSKHFFLEDAYQENADYKVSARREAILAACISAEVSWLVSRQISFQHASAFFF